MRNNQPANVTERRARFTDASHTELELSYPFYGGENHQDNGQQQHVFYTAERYAAKAKRWGRKIYPKPTPFTDGNFKR